MRSRIQILVGLAVVLSSAIALAPAGTAGEADPPVVAVDQTFEPEVTVVTSDDDGEYRVTFRSLEDTAVGQGIPHQPVSDGPNYQPPTPREPLYPTVNADGILQFVAPELVHEHPSAGEGEGACFSSPFGGDHELASGETQTYVIDTDCPDAQDGVIEFHCHKHSEMTGVLVLA